jgi:hypothetical protein
MPKKAFIFPKKPEIPCQLLAYLEARGVLLVRAAIARAPGSALATDQEIVFEVSWDGTSKITITKAQASAWLKWKAAEETLWVKVGVLASIVTVFLAGGAWLLLDV